MVLAKLARHVFWRTSWAPGQPRTLDVDGDGSGCSCRRTPTAAAVVYHAQPGVRKRRINGLVRFVAFFPPPTHIYLFRLVSSVLVYCSSDLMMMLLLLFSRDMVASIDCCRVLRTLGCCRTPEPGGCPVGSVCCFFDVPRCDAVGRRASSRTTKRRRRRVSSRRRSVGSRVSVCFSECVCLLLVFLPPPPPPPGGGGGALFFSSPRHARRVSLCFSRHDCCGHESCLPAPSHADRLASRVADTAVSAHHRTWLSGCRLSSAPTAAAAPSPPASSRRRGRRQRDGENASSNGHLQLVISFYGKKR